MADATPRFERQIYSHLSREAADGLRILLSEQNYVQLAERKEPFTDRWTVEVLLPIQEQETSASIAAGTNG